MNHFADLSKRPPHDSHSQSAPLHTHVERAVRQYFSHLGGETTSDLYDLVLREVEKPLLSVVLEQTRGNQTRAATMLGLNRGTLRKKLKIHGLMSE